MSEAKPMKSLPVSFRFTPTLKQALEQAAKHDDRSVSNLVERVLREWLVTHGHMSQEKT